MMRSRRFQFQVAVLLVSLVFILAILGAYAYVGMGYAQGLPGDRRQLAAIAAQLAPAGTGRLRPWVLAKGRAGGSEGAARVGPTLPDPPAELSLPPGSMTGLYRTSDGELLPVWHRMPGGPSGREGRAERFRFPGEAGGPGGPGGPPGPP